MIGNTLLAVGAKFDFDGTPVTITKLTASRIYFARQDNPEDERFVRHETFLSRAEVLPPVSQAPPVTETTPQVMGVNLADGTDKTVVAVVGCGVVNPIDPSVLQTREFSLKSPVTPWKDEPDTKVFTAHGLKCLIVRNTCSGVLCGYVRLPPGQLKRRLKAYGRILKPKLTSFPGMDRKQFKESSFSKLRRNAMYDHRDVRGLSVHGGLTFSGVPWSHKAKGGLWLGFDCGHCGDLTPKYLHLGFWVEGCVYRNADFVEAELRELAAQIRGLV